MCRFERNPLALRFSFNDRRQISGFFIVLGPPTTEAGEPKLPPYARAEAFKDHEITIGWGRWKLPAVVSLPKGPGPFPGVVIVHGSGPNDRDGTMGPSFKVYPKLNHLFIPGKGKCTPAEYANPGFVDKQVIDDIARWVKAM